MILNSSQVFIVSILLIGCLHNVDMTRDEFQVLEFYAGQRRLARLATQLGQSCAAMDRDYDMVGDNKRSNNCMDLNTNAGFTVLDRRK